MAVVGLATVAVGTAGSLIVFSAGQHLAGTAAPAPVTTGGPPVALRTVALVVVNPSDQHGAVGTPVHLHITLSGAFGAQAFRASGLPAGLAIDAVTGDISGTPAAAGTTSVTVTATDAGGGSGKVVFAWSIDPATVSLTTPGDQHTPVGTAVSLTLGAHASDQGPLTYQASPLPAGLSIDTSTGSISGSPTATGTWTVAVAATSASGATATATFHWTVSPRPVHGPPPPTRPVTTTPKAPPPERSQPGPPPGAGNQPAPGCSGDPNPWDWECWPGSGGDGW